MIDAELFPGSVSFDQCYLPGTSSDEVLLYEYACHPSLANDNLSGLVVATAVGRLLALRPRRLSYRIVFAPATIGAIALLASRRTELSQVGHGLVLSLLRDAAQHSYKQ